MTARRDGHRPGEQLVAPALLAWYDQRQRDLPWRRQVSAYRTLVSEFMLQQTVVAAAVPFFERFVRRFPALRALAAASEEEVLALWSGLGYYARARNLHRAARAVVALHGGEIPGDEAALRELPGIGPYTAAAVAAIAFGRRTFALDGNAARVVARLAAVSAPIDRPATRESLRQIGLAWVPAGRPGDFAQAVMELGATVCTPRAPACASCPLSKPCLARQQEKTGELPVKSARPAKRLVVLAAVRMRHQGKVLLVRRPTGLLAGTWMLPATAVIDGGAALTAARAALRPLGIKAARLTAVGAIRHLFTHRDVTVQLFEGPLAPPLDARGGGGDGGRRATVSAPLAVAPEALWADENLLGQRAVSTFLRKQLALKRDKGGESP